MEAGNRDDEGHPSATLATRQPQPDVPDQSLPLEHYYGYHQHQQDQQHYHPHMHAEHSDGRRGREAPLILPDNSARSTTLPPYSSSHLSQFTSYASHNYESAYANNAARIEHAGDVDPDDFYRNYGGADITRSPESDQQLMASTLPVSRHNPQNASAPRSTGTATKTAVAGRSGLKPSSRSVSAPLDQRTQPASRSRLAYGAGQKPSVKDLKKKFDQHASQSNTNVVGNSGARIPTRETSGSSTARGNYRGVGAVGHPAYMSASYQPTGSSRSSERAKAFPEDQISNNQQSFASRISKPRLSIGAHPQASKSTTSISPAISPALSPSTSTSPAHQARNLLFGEIMPDDNGSGAVGFGIDGIRSRRLSDPDLAVHSGLRQRSLSHTDADGEPMSPSAWYTGLDAAATGNHSSSQLPENTSANRPAKLTKNSNRRRSSPTRPRAPPRSQSAQDTSRPPQSRLPLPVRKLSSPTNSASPPSSRAPSSASMRKQATRARTPTSNRPPSSTSRRPAQLTGVNGNTRLNAYIASPAPKLSPTLRSSRPRQPVSSASTTSSRMKAVERGRQDASRTGKSGEPAPRRRKISMGPIDFESRREQIKLSYTKSIRESEAREAAKKAAEVRRKRLEAEAEAEREKAQAAEEALRLEQQRLREEQERIEADRQEALRQQAEIDEQERLEIERQEIQRERAEFEEQERLALERSKAQQEQEEFERQELARREEQRLRAEYEEAERLEAEQREAERIQAELAEAERLEAEQRENTEIHTVSEENLQDPGATPRPEDQHRQFQPILTVTTDLGGHSYNISNADDDNGVVPGADAVDSPTLGMPGGFPSIAAVAMDDDQAPASAVSTEFDIEPQTEPPQPQQTQTPPPEVDYGADEQDENSVPLIHHRAEYKSPFDEDESPVDTDVPIKISLDALQDASTPVMSPSEPNGVEFPADDDEHRLAALEDEKDNKQETKLAEDSHQVSASEVGRPSEGSVSTACDGSPVLERSSQVTGSQRSLSQDSADPYSFHDQSAGLRQLEEYFVGPSVPHRDSAILLTDSSSLPPQGMEVYQRKTEETEEHDPYNYQNIQHYPQRKLTEDNEQASEDTRGTQATSTSLTVPRTSGSLHRVSQATAWTDYSVNSHEGYSSYSEKAQRDRSNRDSTFLDETSVSETPSRGSRSMRYGDRDSRDFPSSPEASPHDSHRFRLTSYDQHYDDTDSQHIPGSHTGDAFKVDYSAHETSSVVSSVPPSHRPPPPPFADVNSSAAPSEYQNESRPSSYVMAGGKEDQQSLFSMGQSARESEDVTRSDTLTHRSVDQSSLDFRPGALRIDSEQTLADSLSPTQEAQDLPPKEQKRLFTRLQVIKELVDTEAFFIRDMNIVEEIYKGTAEACPKLDDNSIKLIFRNTDQIIAFHSKFLADLKAGVSSIYVPRGHRSTAPKEGSDTQSVASSTAAVGHVNDAKDRETSLGPVFIRHIDQMKAAHETFLKNSDHAAKRLIQIQEDPTVKVWLNECNEVARDLTKAWNLDSLLIKPMQRITKYPTLLVQLLSETPADHPDRPALEKCKAQLENAIEEINKTKKNFELVGQIVGRKRKESDVKAGLARAFGKRVDKLQSASNRPAEDQDYIKLHERFGDDYLRLQVVLRDVEFYTRQVTEYVHEFLQYLSSMELVMRLQPSPHPELESKWVRFNVSMRDIQKVALEQHLSQVRKSVIEPFEMVIKSYGNPSLAMKKRSKRRLDYEKSIQLKKNGKKLDKQLSECVEQYEALNEALKKELPKLSALTEKVGKICLGNLVNIQTQWWAIWKEKVRAVLEESAVPELDDVVSVFQREYKFQEEQIQSIGIVNPASRGRPSQSASANDDAASGSSSRLRPRPTELRGRGHSLGSDLAPSLPTPDFLKRQSGHFSMSPTTSSLPSPAHQFYFRDYYNGAGGNERSGSAGETSDMSAAVSRPPLSMRPGTGQSHDSSNLSATGPVRQSTDTANHTQSTTMFPYPSASPSQGSENHRFSGIFQSALPMSDAHERPPRPSIASSRGSSRERKPIDGFNVLWLAASLFEFNIETTKQEAGYPYLTYQAGEIFDVIAEKGELWLAKNQDDPGNTVGWLWSKHFAKLADD